MDDVEQISNSITSRDLPGDYGPHSTAPEELVITLSSFSSSLKQTSNNQSTEIQRSSFKSQQLSPSASTTQVSPSTTQVSASTDQVSASTAQVVRSYNEEEADYHAVKLAADCLHAQDYSRMVVVLAKETSTIAVLFGRGLACFKLRRFQEATNSLTRMEQLASENLSENGNLYLAHYYLGEIDFTHSRYRKAAEHYFKASQSYSTETVAKRYRIVQLSRATIFSKQGSALRHAQQIMEAVRAYKDALRVAEAKKDKLAVHTSLGNLYQSLGENASALVQYESTVALAEELHDYISLGWAYGNMGNAYLGLYRKEKALKHLEKSLELTIEHEPTPQAIGRAYNNLGTAYQSLNELEKAQEYYDLALSQAIYGMDMGGQARVYGNYGNLLMIQKKFESAIVHYSEALSISTDRSTRSTAHHNRGCAFYEKAEAKKRKLLDTTDIKRDPDKFHITHVRPNFENEGCDPSTRKDYMDGQKDLTEVVNFHEETFQTIKGSANGLNLSVSLFETNSRTFHRLQDCLVNLGEWSEALKFAEQSRARTLGELLLQRKGGQLKEELTSPLSVDQIESIIELVDSTVVFLSYTGSRLLTWVFTPFQGSIVTKKFQVALEDDQFDGKSLDYFLRYSLSEKLIDDSVEMYSYCTYDKSPPLTKLFRVFGRPLLTILSQLNESSNAVRDVIMIPDSYTNLIPVVALLNDASHRFLGDRFCFRTMPSLLTLGVLSQMAEVIVRVPEESQNFCIVGNPTIPPFEYQGETWNLGKLPFATEEAEAVAHILQCSATLHEQATKMVVLSMISGAKVIHLATHGSAAAGFLAFAGLGSSRSRSVSKEELVLLYPKDIEKLSISPALVVLSSCDSGRGTVKADGIQGMARAFILAGAQAVLTTLWRVPDESAAVFMQFFYQYMMDGFKGSHALQKAILSIRSFQKYSRYIHWSGYQLTGREIQFLVDDKARKGEMMRRKIGPCSVFPLLEEVKGLEKVFIKDPYLPTDVQIIFGMHGLKPLEVVIEFVTGHHEHFTGGVFFINAENKHFIMGAEGRIKEELGDPSVDQPVLVIFDNLQSLPSDNGFLSGLLSRDNTHIIIILNSNLALDSLKKEINTKLMRGAYVTELKPLSELHSTQRIVYNVVSKCNFVPYNKEQKMIADLVEKAMGSADLVEVASALLSKYIDEDVEGGRFLEKFHRQVCDNKEPTDDSESYTDDFTYRLVKNFNLSKSDFFVLCTLSLFGTVPIPRFMVETVEVLAIAASPDATGELSPLAQLTSCCLLNVYPSPVILGQQSHLDTPADSFSGSSLTDSDFYYVPQLIADTVRSSMDEWDLTFSVAAAHHTLKKFYAEHVDRKACYFTFMAGLAKILAEAVEKCPEMDDCYKEVFKTYLLYAISDPTD